MNINDLIGLAERLESLSRGSETVLRTNTHLLEELDRIAAELRSQADAIDRDMAAEAEQYEVA